MAGNILQLVHEINPQQFIPFVQNNENSYISFVTIFKFQTSHVMLT